MKKLLALVFSLVLVLGVAGTSNALIWIDVDNTRAGTYSGPSALGTSPVIIEWYHDLPLDLEVPFDIVNSATLQMDIGWIDTDGNDWIEAIQVSFLNTSMTFGPIINVNESNNPEPFTFNITPLFTNGWANGDQLRVNFRVDENEQWNGDLILGASTFTLDYQNVPEPATMLLLGSGLLGMGFVGRKRFKK